MAWLYFHRRQFFTLFKQVLPLPSSLSEYAFSMAGACDMFADATNEFLPEERVKVSGGLLRNTARLMCATQIGSDSIEMATSMLGSLSLQVTGICGKAAEGIISLEGQTSPDKAVELLLHRKKFGAKDENAAKGPGLESLPGNAGKISRCVAVHAPCCLLGTDGVQWCVQFVQRDPQPALHVCRLWWQRDCCCLRQSDRATRAFDCCDPQGLCCTDPWPFERPGWRVAAAHGFAFACRGVFGVPPGRHSLTAVALQAYVQAFSLVEQYVDVDVLSIVRSVLLAHAFSQQLAAPASENQPKKEAMLVDKVAKVRYVARVSDACLN